MADVLAFDAFAHAHYRHHPYHHPAALPDAKAAPGGPVYYRQHEVIQLVEVPAPPPAAHPSTITTSSMPSSSAYTESCDSEGSDEEEESAVSSYCSSDEGDDAARACYDDTYGTRIKRVLAWRDSHARAMAYAMEHSSQHSASQRTRRPDSSSLMHPPKHAQSHHSCSACDADFLSRQALREHARVSSSEACRAAVAYGFES